MTMQSGPIASKSTLLMANTQDDLGSIRKGLAPDRGQNEEHQLSQDDFTRLLRAFPLQIFGSG